jgi:hypothetical protein
VGILRLADKRRGFNVLGTLFGQHQPRVCYNEQGVFAFGVAQALGKFKAFVGV